MFDLFMPRSNWGMPSRDTRLARSSTGQMLVRRRHGSSQIRPAGVQTFSFRALRMNDVVAFPHACETPCDQCDLAGCRRGMSLFLADEPTVRVPLQPSLTLRDRADAEPPVHQLRILLHQDNTIQGVQTDQLARKRQPPLLAGMDQPIRWMLFERSQARDAKTSRHRYWGRAGPLLVVETTLPSFIRSRSQ